MMFSDWIKTAPWSDIDAYVKAMPKAPTRRAQQFMDRAATGASLMASGRPWRGARSLAVNIDDTMMYYKGMTGYLGDADVTARYAVQSAISYATGVAIDADPR